MYLMAAGAVFMNNSFAYKREVIQGNYAMLEFECVLDEIAVNGIDLITFNKEKKISEFKVFIRPLKAVNKIHELMGLMLNL